VTILMDNPPSGTDRPHVDAAGPPRAVRVMAPAAPRGGLVLASPHSGRHYPAALIAASRLDRLALRKSEDAFVDELFAAAPALGATLVTTDFARAWIDMNRAPDELDPALIDGLGKAPLQTSPRVQAGLGVVPRSVGDGAMIYAKRIPAGEALARVRELHAPYHAALSGALDAARRARGLCVLLDCHSMPSAASGTPSVDVVLGDRFGAACAPALTQAAQDALRAAGLSVARNAPYAGGYATERHGKPGDRRHALQIEINRGLYMVEGAMQRRETFAAVRAAMDALVLALIEAGEAMARRFAAPGAD
jgi:N-formylglutamate deformylase